MASKVNYKPLLLEKLKEFSDKCPEYSFGQIVHSVLTQISKKGINVTSKGDILNITDSEIYSCICKSIKEETSNDEPLNQ